MTTDRTTYLLDVGVLVALTNADHVHHGRARAWFVGIDHWATTPMTEAAFVRLMLNPVVAGTQRSAHEVLETLRAMHARRGHVFVTDDSRLTEAVIDLSGLVGHRQVTNLHLVDLAARHGLVLATFDTRISPALLTADRSSVVLV
jgi:toxin-antitoxin system PIN domain toxin